jgi:superfamily II DNA or RNA helicase
MGNRIVPVPKKKMEGEIAKLVKRMGSTVTLEECSDMPAEVDLYEYFEPTREQLRACDDLLDTLPVVRYAKIHQILNGSLKSDGYTEDKLWPCEKLDRVLEIIEENKKLAVVCSHLLEIEAIARQIEGKKKCFILQGSTTDRQSVIDEIEKTEDCVVLISIGVSCGYNLPSISLMVLYSLSYNFVDYEQIRGRIRRIDHPQKCVYINKIYKKTVDEYVFKNISRKQDINLAIYDGKI